MYQAHRPNRLREIVETVAFFVVFFGIVVALSAVEPVR